MIPDEAQRAAEVAYRETLTELRLAEGGGFKVASQNRRALRAALEAAAPHMLQSAKAEAWEEGREYGIDECAGDVTGGINPYGKATK